MRENLLKENRRNENNARPLGTYFQSQKKVFFVRADTYSGTPDRLYRLPEEITRDIGLIRNRIEETKERINVPNVVSEILKESKYREPESFIHELENLVADANDALFELRRLGESLEILEGELKEVKWILGC